VFGVGVVLALKLAFCLSVLYLIAPWLMWLALAALVVRAWAAPRTRKPAAWLTAALLVGVAGLKVALVLALFAGIVVAAWLPAWRATDRS
jgi:hypothetical protein